MAKRILEICVDNIEAAFAAEAAGADRIELCTNLNEGGITPSFAYIEYAVQNLTIPVFPIIRPRGGNFLYTNAEYEIMRKDVLQCKLIGCKGVVFGLLNIDGTIDVERTKMLVQDAGKMEVTFHRAFDSTNNIVLALKDVISTGCKRILTSGLYKNVDDGLQNIQELVSLANDRIIIMPGSGVRSTNIEKLVSATNAIEFHSSAKKMKTGEMNYINPNFSKEENNYQFVDEIEIRKIKENIG